MDINLYISTKLEDQFEEKSADGHDQVIIGLLSNNNVIQSEKRDISHYVFIIEDKSILGSEYIRKNAKMVPTELMAEYTDFRSNEEAKEQVVVFLPIVYHLHSANCKSYREILQYLLRCLMEVDYMAIEGDFGIFQFDQALQNLFQLEKKFWDANQDQWIESTKERRDERWDYTYRDKKQNNPGLDWFLSRRFKNHMYQHTKDYQENISKINDAEFKEEGGWYDTGVVPDETFEKQTHYQIWKESINFEPLPIKEYQNHLTYYEAEILFQLAHRHSKEIFYKLCILFLGSYQLCHLIILNESCSKTIMKQFQSLEETFKSDWWKNLFQGNYFQEPMKYSGYNNNDRHYVHQVYNRMSRILYYEERLLAGTLTTEHRSMVPISFATNLRNPTVQSRYSNDNRREENKFWYLKDLNYFFPFPANTSINYNRPPNSLKVYQKIVDYSTFLDRFRTISGGILAGLDWTGLKVFFTGATAELCYYNNTIFDFEDSAKNSYSGSDMDLAVHIDPEELGITESLSEPGNNDLIKAELHRRAEMICEIVRKNTGLSDLELIPRKNRWIIAHDKLPREIDIFSFIQDPAALIYNYHMATCRVIAQPGLPESDQTPVKILASACLSAMIGSGIDRRWYSSDYSIHHRIIKQFQRGIGLIMNPHETKVIIQYLMKYRENHPEDNNKNAILHSHKFEDFDNIVEFYDPGSDGGYWSRRDQSAKIFATPPI